MDGGREVRAPRYDLSHSGRVPDSLFPRTCAEVSVKGFTVLPDLESLNDANRLPVQGAPERTGARHRNSPELTAPPPRPGASRREVDTQSGHQPGTGTPPTQDPGGQGRGLSVRTGRASKVVVDLVLVTRDVVVAVADMSLHRLLSLADPVVRRSTAGPRGAGEGPWGATDWGGGAGEWATGEGRD